MHKSPASSRSTASKGRGRRRHSGATAVFAAGLLLAFVLQASWAARRDSVTIDEFVHLPVGLYMLRTGDFGVDPINPPLGRMIAALPLLLDGVPFRPPPGTNHWAMGYRFMQQHMAEYQSLFVRARRTTIALAALLGLLVFWWAARLYGRPAGVVALFLFAFSPSLLTHGHLVTLDMAGALGFVTTAYAAWWFLDAPGPLRAVLLGVALGGTMLLKLSGASLVAALFLCVIIAALAERGNRARPGLWQWLLLLGTAATAFLAVLDLGYGFQGIFTPLGDIAFHKGGRLDSLSAIFPGLRLSLPLSFLLGVDKVMNSGAARDPSYFLAGSLSATGWWYYHIAAFLLKTPLPLIGSALAATGLWLGGRSRGKRDYCVFVPVLALFAFNSLFNSLDIGVRHVLPAYPLLLIAASPLLADPLHALFHHGKSRGRLAAAGAVTAALAWYLAAGVSVAPRYFQYFNEVAGGPDRGHLMLVDSNLDWGQDLIRLREYMSARGWKWINLAYFGRVHPAVYGIRFQPLEKGRSHGPTAVSASFLMGRPYFWFYRGALRWVPSRTYTWLRRYEPVARVGSMFIYDLP